MKTKLLKVTDQIEDLKKKLDITDRKMLELIDHLKTTGEIRYRQEFCDAIDLPKQNIYNIKKGKQHFTAAHIFRACKIYYVNANWIMGLEDQIFSKEKHSRIVKRRHAVK
jgi:hypothetical protein